jgi:transcriptional/translational regulatory protein YebC/TACO1
MVECLTDNPNRTAPNMRVCFRKGQMTAVAWDFDHVGMIEGEPKTAPTWKWPPSKPAPRILKPAKKRA